MNNNIINKAYNFLVLVIFWELLLGGLGNLFGFPVRKVLFILGIVATIAIMFINKVKLKKIFLMPIVLIGIYTVYGSVIGLINGNSIRDIFSDANVFLGVVYILLLTNYFRENIKKIDKFLNIVVDGSLIISIITLVLFFFSRYYLPNDLTIIDRYMELNSTFNYGLITGLVYSNNYARVYLFNGIFMQIGASILMIRLLRKNTEKKTSMIVKLVVIMLGIFTSSTRGFWLGTAIAVVLVFAYYLYRGHKNSDLTLKNLVIAGLVSVVFMVIIPKTVGVNSIKNIINNTMVDEIQINGGHLDTITGTETVGDRIASMVDFKGNLSNRVRLVQLEFLLERTIEKPVLGWGFGAHIHEYAEFMEANNMPPVHTSSFELYYFELLFKTGVVGIIALFAYLFYKLSQLIRMLMMYKLEETEMEILFAWSIGFISFMASSFTNPYLASLSGFFILVIQIYISETLLEKYPLKSKLGSKTEKKDEPGVVNL